MIVVVLGLLLGVGTIVLFSRITNQLSGINEQVSKDLAMQIGSAALEPQFPLPSALLTGIFYGVSYLLPFLFVLKQKNQEQQIA